MPEKSIDLIVKISLSHRQGYDNKPYGAFEASVLGVNAQAGYDDDPFTYWLSAYETPWAHFAMEASYGNLRLADGYAYGFGYGFKPERTLVNISEAKRYAEGLKKVERAYQKRCADNGNPKTLGQEVIYVLRALGVTTAAWRLPKGRTGNQYRDWRVCSDIQMIQHHIDSTLEEFRTARLEAQQAA